MIIPIIRGGGGWKMMINIITFLWYKWVENARQRDTKVIKWSNLVTFDVWNYYKNIYRVSTVVSGTIRKNDDYYHIRREGGGQRVMIEIIICVNDENDGRPLTHIWRNNDYHQIALITWWERYWRTKSEWKSTIVLIQRLEVHTLLTDWTIELGFPI